MQISENGYDITYNFKCLHSLVMQFGTVDLQKYMCRYMYSQNYIYYHCMKFMEIRYATRLCPRKQR